MDKLNRTNGLLRKYAASCENLSPKGSLISSQRRESVTICERTASLALFVPFLSPFS